MVKKIEAVGDRDSVQGFASIGLEVFFADEKQDAEKLLTEGEFQLIIADPLLRCFAPKNSKWIDLPHKVFQLYGNHQALPELLGTNLNTWLDIEKSITGE